MPAHSAVHLRQKRRGHLHTGNAAHIKGRRQTADVPRRRRRPPRTAARNGAAPPSSRSLKYPPAERNSCSLRPREGRRFPSPQNIGRKIRRTARIRWNPRRQNFSVRDEKGQAGFARAFPDVYFSFRRRSFQDDFFHEDLPCGAAFRRDKFPCFRGFPRTALWIFQSRRAPFKKLFRMTGKILSILR